MPIEVSSRDACCNLVEAHCYGVGMTGQLLSNHVAVETDRNVRRFDREGIVTDEDLRS